MKLGVPMEPEGETRVGIVPSSMKKLLKAGFEVEYAAFFDDRYLQNLYSGEDL